MPSSLPTPSLPFSGLLRAFCTLLSYTNFLAPGFLLPWGSRKHQQDIGEREGREVVILISPYPFSAQFSPGSEPVRLQLQVPVGGSPETTELAGSSNTICVLYSHQA